MDVAQNRKHKTKTKQEFKQETDMNQIGRKVRDQNEQRSFK